MFKRKSLRAIERRKLLRKYGLWCLVALAAIMFCAVVFVYTMG